MRWGKLLVVHLPAINLVQNGLGFCFPMLVFEVLTDPLNEVILEYPLDELVKQIWSDELVDVGVGKVLGKWLNGDD